MHELSIEARLANLVSTYPSPQLAILPALSHVAQEGVISEASVELVAKLCKVDVESIRVLLDSYPSLSRAENGSAVCMGVSCFLNGAQHVYTYLSEDPKRSGLEIDRLELSSCLGYCFAAPVFRGPDGVIYRAQVPHKISHGKNPDRDL